MATEPVRIGDLAGHPTAPTRRSTSTTSAHPAMRMVCPATSRTPNRTIGARTLAPPTHLRRRAYSAATGAPRRSPSRHSRSVTSGGPIGRHGVESHHCLASDSKLICSAYAVATTNQATAHVAARQSAGSYGQLEHLSITDLVHSTGRPTSRVGECPGQGLYESPLTESNRRPSPYHRVWLFILLSDESLFLRIIAGSRHTIEVSQYR